MLYNSSHKGQPRPFKQCAAIPNGHPRIMQYHAICYISTINNQEKTKTECSKAKKKTKVHKHRGTYRMRAWLIPEGGQPMEVIAALLAGREHEREE